MANMGYVRFQNTLNDLRDCSQRLFDEDLSPEDQRARRRLIELLRDCNQHLFDEDLSPEEQRARRRLIELCREIAAEFDGDDDLGDEK
jgi:hypothetical protein